MTKESDRLQVGWGVLEELVSLESLQVRLGFSEGLERW